jgi:hypothetical protein
MWKPDWVLKTTLMVLTFFLGMIAVRPLLHPDHEVSAQSARFDHVYIVSPVFIYKGQTGLLVMDRRNANVWFIPKVDEKFQNPIYVFRVPFEKLDEVPR